MLHHSPGSPRYTFASVEPNQKEYVGYYRLTIESTVIAALQSDVVKSRNLLLSQPVCPCGPGFGYATA